MVPLSSLLKYQLRQGTVYGNALFEKKRINHIFFMTKIFNLFATIVLNLRTGPRIDEE